MDTLFLGKRLFLQAIIQRIAANSQQFRGVGFVVLGALQCLLEQVAFQWIQIDPVFRQVEGCAA